MSKMFKGIIVFVIFVLFGILVSTFLFNKKPEPIKYTTVVGAVGGGKENFLKDEDIKSILKYNYNIEIKADEWSNNSLVKDSLEYLNDNGESVLYDFIFFSDERFYEYYKSPANNDEVPREKILESKIILNTPIVIYSWDKICDKFIEQGIVKENNGTYYISDMKKLLNYISEGEKWEDIGLSQIFGKINIDSPDPVKSSPGATYYGLLASIMNDGYVDENSITSVLPNLKTFYKYSGFMNQTPADIFDQYLRTGLGAKPMIVDYEKSIIDFANQNPDDYNNIKSSIRILYPEPTIWNSHCIIALTENGKKYIEALKDKDIQSIAWKKFGFRSSSSVNTGDIIVEGIPSQITSVTPGLKKNIYDEIINGLKNN